MPEGEREGCYNAFMGKKDRLAELHIDLRLVDVMCPWCTRWFYFKWGEGADMDCPHCASRITLKSVATALKGQVDYYLDE
jgi:DNA-directed RNA polymerase subunit RPC12/RpoP